MAKKRSRVNYISPIHPSLHFVLFLILAFILVVIVGVFMKATAVQTRAKLFCPQSEQVTDSNFVETMAKQCGSLGIKFTKDATGCNVIVCDLP